MVISYLKWDNLSFNLFSFYLFHNYLFYVVSTGNDPVSNALQAFANPSQLRYHFWSLLQHLSSTFLAGHPSWVPLIDVSFITLDGTSRVTLRKAEDPTPVREFITKPCFQDMSPLQCSCLTFQLTKDNIGFEPMDGGLPRPRLRAGCNQPLYQLPLVSTASGNRTHVYAKFWRLAASIS